MDGVFQCTCDVTFVWVGGIAAFVAWCGFAAHGHLAALLLWLFALILGPWVTRISAFSGGSATVKIFLWPTSIGRGIQVIAKSQTLASCGPLHSEVFSLTFTYFDFDFDWPSPKPDFDRQCHPHFPKIREAWGLKIVKWKKTHPAPWCWVNIAFLLSKGVWACVGMLPYLDFGRNLYKYWDSMKMFLHWDNE